MSGSPVTPDDMDWSQHYPAFFNQNSESKESLVGDGISNELDGRNNRAVEIADIGCGFGGLLMALAPKFPNTLLLGR